MRDVQRFTAGDSLSFTTTVDSYPASAGWTLVYCLVPRFTSPAQDPITLTATTHETDGYRVDIVANDTAAWAPGAYGWSSWVQRTGERISLEAGQLTILPDPAQATQGLDTRTDAAITLANIRAMRLGAASKNVRSYTINSGGGARSLEHFSPDELKALEQEYAIKVAREENAARMAAGLKSRRKTFGRVARA